MADTAAASTRAEEPSGSMTEAKREISAVQLLTKDGQDRQGKQDLAEQAVRWGIKLTPPLGKFLIELAFELAGLAAVVAFGVYAVKSVTVANRGNSFSDLALLQALISNQLTLLTLCLSSSGNETGTFSSICSRVVQNAATLVPSAATVLYSLSPEITSTQVSTSATSSSAATTASNAPPSASTAPIISDGSGNGSIQAGAIAGIVVGSVVGLALLGICLAFMIRRRKARTQGDYYNEDFEPQRPGLGLGVDTVAHEVHVNPEVEGHPTYQQPEPTVRKRPTASRGLKRVAAGFRELFLESTVTNLGEPVRG